ncbi:translationally-controlled tumor protein homolog [Dendronephthya gigantea]|uniref:translationally-controlled tumor protein homolog n=1 Tax=Dendronephthya gigantea TaxID=151771 RepID=UPI001069DD15|nr:translationally-controlled tumor protein homolog [Dendronephthya gigantea]
MIIYKDRITGDELFSDNFPMKLIDGMYYEVEGKTVAENSGSIDESLIGGNKSAEEPTEEEYSSDTTYGVNIILTHRLRPAVPIAAKDYATVIKPGLKLILEKLTNEGKEDEAAFFKSNLPAVVKKIKKMWDDLVVYQGESDEENGLICFLNYRENGDPYMIFLKHWLIEEKV